MIDVLRGLAPRVLGSLMRRYGNFARCEDAVQEALIAAVERWPRQVVPGHPLAWLRIVATRRYIDLVRADSARADREVAAYTAQPRDALVVPPPDTEPVRDDVLELLFLCCHPALTGASQLALTLRAVGGLTTGEIAAPNPVATLNRALAVGMVHGPDAGLQLLDDLELGVLNGNHRAGPRRPWQRRQLAL